MNSEERSHALELADELLSDVELDRIPLDKLLLKGARLARLTSDDEFAKWIKKELSSYSANDFNGKYWRLTMRGSKKEEGTYTGAAHLAVYIDTLTMELKGLNLPSISGNYATVATRAALDHIGGVRNAITRHNQVVTAARNVLHDFVSKHYYLLRFSIHQGEMFEAAKKSIDGVLSGMPGDALRKIDSAYANISAGDPEAIAGAMNSVRRLVDAVADAVFPSTDEVRRDGQGNAIKLGAQHRLNRIKAHIDDYVDSKGRGDRMKRAVGDIYARVSSGVHNDVAASEARYLFLSAYVLLGEISSLSVSETKKVPERPDGNAE
ncbi:hypothetical protein ABMX48_26330 [Streptomyces cavourensis]